MHLPGKFHKHCAVALCYHCERFNFYGFFIMLESHKNAKPHSTRGISPVYITVQAVGRYTVLILSVIMIVWITRDTLEGISMATSARYMHFQFWVCVFFLADILIETFGAPRGRRLRWLARHWLFVMVSVPWLTLFQWSGITLGNTVAYIIKFIPMIRTGYVVALVTGALTSNKAVSMTAVYVMWVIASVYFGSLMFYVEESPVNEAVTSWPISLWWASVSMTTLGCSIQPVTVTGRVLAMVLSCEGVMLFPVFTVYVTNAVREREKRGSMTLDSFRITRVRPPEQSAEAPNSAAGVQSDAHNVENEPEKS